MEHYLSRAETWLFITILVYFLMNGAQVFETAVLVPKWSAAPPASFHLLADPNGIGLKPFWIVFHSIHELTFILAIVFCWKLDPIRNGLLFLFAVHLAIRAWTLLYFAPNIIDFRKIASTGGDSIGLVRRASLWRALNYLRVGLFIAVSIGLIPLYLEVLKLK